MLKSRILIVDDEPDFTSLVKLNLEDTGRYEVKEENQGSGGLESARKFRPDLILMDVMMTDMDGGEVASQIKSDIRLKDIPLVFLTAVVTKEEVNNKPGLICGYPFIAKPIDPDQLMFWIEEYLDNTVQVS